MAAKAKTQDKPPVTDPFSGKILVADEDFAPKVKPIPESVIKFAETLNAKGKAVVSVAGWSDEDVIAFTKVIRQNGRTLFPGHRVRITPGTISTGPALRFSLGALGERKTKAAE